MMLITIMLVIEDRCNTSFAQNTCYVHISFIIGDENVCKTKSVFYFKLSPSCGFACLNLFQKSAADIGLAMQFSVTRSHRCHPMTSDDTPVMRCPDRVAYFFSLNSL